jgi:hypothetical protein
MNLLVTPSQWEVMKSIASMQVNGESACIEVEARKVSPRTPLQNPSLTRTRTRERNGDGNRGVGKGEGTTQTLPSEAEFWNSHCESLPAVKHVSKSRAAKLRVRRRDEFWNDHFKEAVDKVMKSSFCRGENDRGWTATFDWLLQPDTLTKIIEGKYDDRRKTPQTLLDRQKEAGGLKGQAYAASVRTVGS